MGQSHELGAGGLEIFENSLNIMNVEVHKTIPTDDEVTIADRRLGNIGVFKSPFFVPEELSIFFDQIRNDVVTNVLNPDEIHL